MCPSSLKADGHAAPRRPNSVSHGKPSNVTVKAVLYTDDTYSTTTTVELGVDNKVLKEFSFGKLKNDGRALAEYTAVKDLVFEWAEGTMPRDFADVYLLGALSGMDSDLIAELQETVDAAGQQDTSAWTTDSINALNAAVEQAKDAIAHPESLTADQVGDIKAAIETALNSPVLKYTGTELSELVNGAITDGSRYTDETWQAYGEALAAAKAGLENRATTFPRPRLSSW